MRKFFKCCFTMASFAAIIGGIAYYFKKGVNPQDNDDFVDDFDDYDEFDDLDDLDDYDDGYDDEYDNMHIDKREYVTLNMGTEIGKDAPVESYDDEYGNTDFVEPVVGESIASEQVQIPLADVTMESTQMSE